MSDHDPTEATVTSSPLLVAAAWLLVGLPLLYGLWQTLSRAAQLFG